MTDPYSTPEADVTIPRPSNNIPWLWTLYNGYVLFAATMIVIFYLTGKTPEMFRALVEADPAAPADSRANAIAFGLMLFNYLFTLMLVAIGYLLVWRLNRRGKIALFLYALYMLALFGLGAFSFSSEFDLPGYEITLLDYIGGIVGNAWVLALLVWGIWGWNRFKLPAD